MPEDPMNPPPRQPSRGNGQAGRLELSIALSENENTRAVLDGRVLSEIPNVPTRDRNRVLSPDR